MQVFKASSTGEAIELLGKYGAEGKIIAGGTDIIISMRSKGLKPGSLIDISSIGELALIEEEGAYINIGAGSSFTEIAGNPLFHGQLYGLAKACEMVGSPQIRNRGTLGGNIANKSSAADSIPPLLCLEASMILKSREGTRELDLMEYYGEDLPLNERELITTIKFKKPKKNQVLSFGKLGLRKALAISRLSIASLLELDEEGRIISIRLASGSLGKYPMREPELEEFLLGQIANKDTIDRGIEVLQATMDKRLGGRSTLPYKRKAVDEIFRQVLEDGIDKSKGVVS